MASRAYSTFVPDGPFDLSNQTQYFGEWLVPSSEADAIVMVFPVEGWQGSSAVMLKQASPASMKIRVFGQPSLRDKASKQALAALSLDVDGTEWPRVGDRDTVIGSLQKKYDYLRPVLFQSPYEAAAAFIIGHRISIKQRRAIISRLSADIGQEVDVDGQSFSAFPLPQRLLSLDRFAGLSDRKMQQLHAVARAAIDGVLDRQELRSLPVERALSRLQELPGIGPFYAQGILHRGAGVVDAITDDEVSRYAIQSAYRLGQSPDIETMVKISTAWIPFRMWAMVLLHVWLRREVGLPRRTVRTRRMS